MKKQNFNINISVVICTYNRSLLLQKCLDSLSCQSIGIFRYEVIIVDNNSTDNTQDVIQRYLDEFTQFRCVREPRQGLSYARNRGFQEALGKYVAFIDDDAKASPDWLELIVDAFEKIHPRPAAVGGEIHPYYEEPPPDWFTDDFEIRSWGNVAKFLERPDSIFGFSGSNMSFSKDVLVACGGFNTSLGMKGNNIGLGEEADLFFRMSQYNAQLWYDPNIKVCHWTPNKNIKTTYRMKRSFCAGRSRAQILGHTFFSRETVIELLHLSAMPIALLVTILKNMGSKRSASVKFIQRLSNRIGFIFGRKL